MISIPFTSVRVKSGARKFVNEIMLIHFSEGSFRYIYFFQRGYDLKLALK